MSEVRLSNIRSHRETSVPLRRGLNVVHGLNGTGKSTVVEAAAYALFDALPPRPGATAGELVRNGTPLGQIEVCLECDEQTYVVRRRVSSAGKSELWELREDDEGPVCAKGMAEVTEWLRQRMGIGQLPMGRLFPNVLGAFQGEMAAPFEQGAGSRRAFFEEVLAVDRWREMGRSLRETAEAELGQDKLAVILREIEELRGRLNAHRDVPASLMGARRELERSQARLEEADAREKSAAEEAERLRLRERQLEHLRDLHQGLMRRLTAARRARERARSLHERSEEAAGRLRTHDGDHDVYLQQLAVVAQCQRDEKRRRELERRHAEARVTRVQLQAQLDTVRKRLDEARDKVRSRLAELATRAETLEGELTEREVALHDAEARLEGQEAIEVTLLELEQHRAALRAGRARGRGLLDRWHASGRGDLSVEGYEAVQGDVLAAEAELQALSARISDAAALSTDLARKRCPFLSEACPSERADELIAIVTERREQLTSSFGALERRLAGQLRPQLEAARQGREGGQLLQQLGDLVFEVLEPAAQALADIDAPSLGVDGETPEARSFAAVTDGLRAWAGSDPEDGGRAVEAFELLFAGVEAATGDLDSAARRLIRERIEDAKEARRNLDQRIGETAAAAAQRERLEAELETLEAEREALEDLENMVLDATEQEGQEAMSLAEFEGLDLRLSEAETALETYQEAFLAWERAEPDAALLAERAAAFEEAGAELSDIERQIDEATSRLVEVRESITEDDLQVALSDASRAAEALLAARERQARLEERVRNLEAANDRVERWTRDLAAAEARRDKFQRSYELALAVADRMLLEAGPRIAADLVEQVSAVAAEIYADIAPGDDSRLAWGAEDFRLALSIDGGDHPLRFTQLSGGQQAVAALAVRLGLFRTAARRAGFVVLDEPTTHLDRERRESLADALARLWTDSGGALAGEAAGWIEQIVLTTHDDAFDTLPIHRVELRRDAAGLTRVL